MSHSNHGGPSHAGAILSDGRGVVEGDSPKNLQMIHHDDVIATTPNVDINSPIKLILRKCDYFIRASDASLEFQRPDIALQQYLQASIIAIEIIPRHKEYCDLQFDHPELYKYYTSLTNRIESQNAKFMEAKNLIKKNNLHHGTQSVVGKSTSTSYSDLGTASKDISRQSDGSFSQTSASNRTGKPFKQRPVIQPKPDGLHGQPISSQNGQTPKNDLVSRFSRLRSSQSNSPKQDPRIRTQLIPITPESAPNTKVGSGPQQVDTSIRPIGPRDMPSVPKTKPQMTKIPLDVEIPNLPRAPDAIYSPARGPELPGSNNLPPIVRKNTFLINGQQSASSNSKVVSSPVKAEGKKSSVALARKLNLLTEFTGDQKDKQISFPNSTSVTCEELVRLLARGTQVLNILLVDLRTREAFDNGHIMSQSIICVEPLTLRREISGDELSDSMVIAPDAEQLMFERRNEFDLVVVYDQSSSKMTDNGKLIDFTAAVYDYGYEKKLKYPPLLLIDGLDGWIDLLGPSSLATSSTGTSIKHTHLPMKLARPLTRNSSRESPCSLTERQKRHYSRPLTMEQENVWASTIKDDLANISPAQTETVDELIYARTTEDFIRRYPELPSVQESMISPTAPNIYESQLVSVMPRPPARPAPTIPRQRSSGISEKSTSLSYVQTIPNGDTSILENRRPVGLTGLTNPRVLCYMNTVLQGLSATPWFRELIRNYVHPANPPIPKREGESTDPPQLMVRCLSVVFAHLWFGQYEFINPTTFQSYVNAVHNRGPGGFGGVRVQHDCSEFLVMLIDILDDELNPLRNLPGRRPIEEIEGSLEKAPTILDAAAIYWADWTSNLGSPITRKMKGVTARILTCDLCGKSRPVFDQFQQLLLAIPPDGAYTLNDILDSSYGPNSELIEYQSLQCSKCCQNTSQKGRIYLIYLPDTLIISIMRMTNSLAKIKTRVTVPLTVNFENNIVKNQVGSKNQDVRCTGPFLYDVYGLGLHSGNTLASGHYRMLARSLDQLAAGKPAGSWHMFDDKNVTPFNVMAVDPSEISLVFLQRQGRF